MGPGLESAIRAMMYGDMGEEGESTYDQDELGRVLSIIRRKNGEIIAKINPKRCQIVKESTAENSPHLDDLEEEQSRRKEGEGRGAGSKEGRAGSARQNVRWVCPKCRGGCGTGCLNNCCNISSCRKSQNLAPTGLMHKTAISHDFNNVHDYLIHMETGESAAAIAKSKQGHRWMSVDSGIVAVDMEPGMEQQKSSPGWAKKKSRSARLVGSSKRKVERRSSDRQKQHKMLSGEQTWRTCSLISKQRIK